MSIRKGLLGVAVAAGLAVSGSAYAAEDVTMTPPAASSRTPLMELLNMAGAAEPLENLGITVGGRIEGSYTYSMSNPPDGIITGRVFDFENQDPTLNQIGLFVDKQVDVTKFDVGGRMEWIWGADSRLIHSVGLFDHHGVDDGPGNQWDLNQAYLDVALGSGWKVRAGKFVTPIGLEVIDPTQNKLYSHSYMFGYAIPFTHTGVMATHKVNDGFEYAFGGSRGWDTSLEDNNDTFDILGSLKWTINDPQTLTTIQLNVVSGPDQPGDNDNWRTLVDLIIIAKLGNSIEFGFNGDWGYEVNSTSTAEGSDAMWWGVAGYVTGYLSPEVAITARGEYFNDDDGARLTGAVNGAGLFEATLGLQIKPFANHAIGKGLVIRPEVRYDYSTKGFFDGGTDNYQVTAGIDAYFAF